MERMGGGEKGEEKGDRGYRILARNATETV